ncbi:MAG: 3-isopropylmalate dehydratase small subunit [Gemmatimonadetes bacterium]|nr:3-isopropylmalate dehydratase small subunit [Gemmatimonadota bacterium]
MPQAHPGFVQFTRHTGIAAPFLHDDFEGELIAPLGPELLDLHEVHMDRHTAVLETHAHDGSWPGQHAFQGFRYALDGSEIPEFVLNQEPHRDASILVTGRNFGQGSLQAFAAIRLRQCGMRVIIAPSFGPVFYDDCFDYGLLPVTLTQAEVDRIAEQVGANPRLPITVDLVGQVVTRADFGPIRFQMDARRRMNLLQGSDQSLEERLQHQDSAAAAREQDRRVRPWLYDTRREPGR